MLRELHISNLAIIEKVDIELAAGLNVFTGQTGAGKSLILGSLELLLGMHGGEEAAVFVRPGCAEARVSGVFEIAHPERARLLGEVLDQPLTADEPLIVTRRVFATGRSSASVNGAPVTAAMLRQAGQFLVDIHGQHDQQFLLKPANQLTILDAYADAEGARAEFAQVMRRLREAQQRLSELRASQARRDEMLDLYRFQVEEIDAAGLAPGEYAQTKARYGVLKNVAHLKSQSAVVLESLSEGEETVLDRLGALAGLVQELTRTDGRLAELSGQVRQAQDILQDVAKALSRYQDALDIDPGELSRTQERLDLLNRLIHKYARESAGDDPVAAVLAYRRDVGRKIAEMDSSGQAMADLEAQIAAGREQLARLGGRLTRLRSRAADALKPLVEAQFADLEMHEATFDVDIQTRDAADQQIDGSGLDVVEFLVRTNPGQERLPLRKIASGGEISRIMLALKTILSDKDQVSVLVFDEIDAAIGDRLGAAIGRKMRALAGGHGPGRKSASRSGGHQILCITHLSQIAACADRHLRISKRVAGGGDDRRTVTQVRVLEGADRVEELAEMMAGKNVSQATLAHAHDLLNRRQKTPAAAAVS